MVASLFDQSALVTMAQRLVTSAARAGADAADAIAIRSVSLSVEVREGVVEESERAEGDDIGLRVFLGRRQAVVSTNDVSDAGVAALAERALAMARAAPEDRFAGLADRERLAQDIPDLDLVDHELPGVERLEALALTAEAAALEVSVRTAESHHANLMAKLGVNSLADLVRIALRDNIT